MRSFQPRVFALRDETRCRPGPSSVNLDSTPSGTTTADSGTTVTTLRKEHDDIPAHRTARTNAIANVHIVFIHPKLVRVQRLSRADTPPAYNSALKHVYCRLIITFQTTRSRQCWKPLKA
jgi:hypothetical protein